MVGVIRSFLAADGSGKAFDKNRPRKVEICLESKSGRGRLISTTINYLVNEDNNRDDRGTAGENTISDETRGGEGGEKIPSPL